jgi:hypothetical protein
MAELKTYGDLKKVIKAISLKQKGEKIGNLALDQVVGLIPGAGAAKTTFDFIKAAFKKPDAKKTNTWLDKLDIDDQMSAIVDDTVENGFMQAMSKSIEQESDTTPLEPDFNMNAKMVNYLKQQYGGRTVAGIKENKNMTLKEYIKSLIRKQLEEISATGAIGVGAGPIMTPYAFSKGKGKNKATKQAEEEGWKVTKGETTMPGDSKVKDYVSLTGKKKKKVKIYQESGYTQASPSSRESGYTASSPSSRPSLYLQKSEYTSENMNKNKGKRYIPDQFEFPEFLLKPITVGREEPRIYFKIVSKGDESILLIDPLVAIALGAIQRGRTSFDKQQNLSALTRFLSDKMPPSVRGLVKKYSIGADIQSNGFMALPLVMSKKPMSSSSIKNSIVKINNTGVGILKNIKADPSKAKGFEDEFQFLVYLYKNKEATPAEYAGKVEISPIMASRIANNLNKQGAVDVEAVQDTEVEGDTWYIRNPFKAGTVPGINVPMYESLKNVIEQELLNEVTYHKFKNEVKFRTKNEQLHKAIREVKRKLSEIDRIVEYTSRMKQELSEGEEGVRYWKATQKNVATISEMVNQLNNKIKNLQQ